MTDVWDIVGGIAAVIAIIGSIYSFYKLSFNKGKNSSDSDLSEKRKYEAFTKLYAPLRVELTNTRFVTYSSMNYPTFRHRFLRAYKEFSNQKNYGAKFVAFKKAIGDKGESVSIECDTSFPSNKIKSIIYQYPQYADKDLIDRVHQLEVMGATPWDHDEEEIIKNQYHLANYINEKYNALHDELHNKGN